MNIQKQRVHGFTLVELIIVIVILGILSVVAAPRFINLGKDARVAKINSMKAALVATSNMIHYKCQMDKDCDLKLWAPPQMIDGKAACLLEGYFDAGAGGYMGATGIGSCSIDASVNFSEEFVVATPSGADNSLEHHFQLSSAPDQENCYAAYRQPVNSGDRPVFKTETTGC